MFVAVVPLVHLDTMVGFILIERTLAPRMLNWEDFELLRTLGRQAASYIAETSTQMALDEANKFDEFNRRFSFIMHDIKNLVSQLSLVARNAERHAENPAFVYEHAWRVGDLLLWDNRNSSHARRDFPATERRLMLRTTVKGGGRPV